MIDVDGATLSDEKRGAGPPVVLIHGGLASSAMWAPLLPSLVDGFQIITPDGRGQGRSIDPSGRLSYAQIADELASRHPDTSGALIVGAAYPTFAISGLRERNKAFAGAVPNGELGVCSNADHFASITPEARRDVRRHDLDFARRHSSAR